MTNQTKTNHLNYLIDPTFKKDQLIICFYRSKMKNILFEILRTKSWNKRL